MYDFDESSLKQALFEDDRLIYERRFGLSPLKLFADIDKSEGRVFRNEGKTDFYRKLFLLLRDLPTEITSADALRGGIDEAARVLGRLSTTEYRAVQHDKKALQEHGEFSSRKDRAEWKRLKQRGREFAQLERDLLQRRPGIPGKPIASWCERNLAIVASHVSEILERY